MGASHKGRAGSQDTRRVSQAQSRVSGTIAAYPLGSTAAEFPMERGRALVTLEQRPYAVWLLGVVAVGLHCYGLFMLVEAKYRRIIEDR